MFICDSFHGIKNARLKKPTCVCVCCDKSYIPFDTASTTVMTHDQSDIRKAHFVIHEYELKQNCPEVNVQKLVISN